jgi:hypothetical protein
LEWFALSENFTNPKAMTPNVISIFYASSVILFAGDQEFFVNAGLTHHVDA